MLYSTAILCSLLIPTDVPVEVTRLDGERLSGQLESVSENEVVVVVDDERRTIPVGELQAIQPSSPNGPAAVSTNRAETAVSLRDGSLLMPDGYASTAREATLTFADWDDLHLPKDSISSVRISRSDQNLTTVWNALLERKHRDDLIVVRKGDALDHVEGVVGTITAETVNLLLDGRSVSVPRGRVFGVIFATRDDLSGKALCRFDLNDGQQLMAQSARFNDDGFIVELLSGGTVELATTLIRRIDFSLGKIRALADMEPVAVTYPEDLLPELASVWKFRRGRNSWGKPLLLGGTSYDEGLWIHSGTTLRYRLGREYRRFQGLMGIDEGIGDCTPTVGIAITGDGRILLDTSISRGDEVHELDLDVTDVRELVIEVKSTDPDGICEHLDLVEARLIK